MNPDQSSMDQFDLDVRVSTPREFTADGDVQPQFTGTCLFTKALTRCFC